MAGERREVPLQKHAYRCFCAYSPVECLSRMGMGYRRQRAGTGLPEEIRIGDGFERAHPPDYAEDRRQRDISHRDVHCLPQPAPGSAPSPGPMKVADEKLRSVLGITDVNFVQGNHALAVTDQALTG